MSENVDRIVKQGRLDLSRVMSIIYIWSVVENEIYLERNLKDSSSIDDRLIVAGHLNPFHLFERLHHTEIFAVNGSECRYVDVVVLEGL